MSLFNDLVNIKQGIQNRQISRAKTPAGDPIVEIFEDGDTLHLKFVRSTPVFKLNDTMKQFLCYAVKKGIKNVKLQDDALFTDNADTECKYNALLYRALTGKPSIYDKYEFKPADSTVNVADLLEIISKYTREQANKELSKFIDKIGNVAEKRELFSKILEVKEENKKDLFGEYVTKLECNDMRQVINILRELASKIEKDGNLFLGSLHEYYVAHTNLTREPTCEGKGGGMVRHRARSSSRTKKYRRNTRTNRHNYKRTSKKRSNY